MHVNGHRYPVPLSGRKLIPTFAGDMSWINSIDDDSSQYIYNAYYLGALIILKCYTSRQNQCTHIIRLRCMYQIHVFLTDRLATTKPRE